ncbi:MAG: hypothetical protein AAF483_26785, partial [Planctomycetota bacterium]
AVSQTLRQEMAAMDTVAIARIVPGSETDSTALFSVRTIINGQELLQTKQELSINYFGKAKEEQNFLIMGVDPPELLWSSPLPVSDVAVKYVESIQNLPEDAMARLEFYMQYLEHPESLLARDAYSEFASADYPLIQDLKPKMDREQLLEWVQDDSLPPDRKRLYFVMLGICGKRSDAKLLEELLRSEDPNRRAGLDSLIACFATLKGAEGLDVIDELFLKNKKSQYADTYSTIMALRFHANDTDVIEKQRVLQSMRLLLDRPALADLVIPDLARLGDWSQIDKLVELFKTADQKSSWVRVPIINYLRICPKPEAEESLKELKEIDPAAYKRAISFFPVPRANSDNSTDTSSNSSPTQFRYVASYGQPEYLTSMAPNVQLASLVSPDYSDAAAAKSSGKPIIAVDLDSNRISAISVVSMFSVTLWIAMWLFIGGAGNSPLLCILTKQRS